MIPKFIVSTGLLLTAGTLALLYFRKSTNLPAATHPFAGHRPWRKVGAAICLLIAVMFVLGIYLVDVPQRPVPYALYWIIMLGLVVWLFVLALRDIMYTRRLARQWRLGIRKREMEKSPASRER